MIARLEDRLVNAGVADPFIEGALRFSEAPIVLSSTTWTEIQIVAERVAQAYDELVALVSEEPNLLETFFDLAPTQTLMWQISAPFWHVFGRVDLFQTADGWKTSEMNCDTPTGQAEVAALATVLEISEPQSRYAKMHDPNLELEQRFVHSVCRTAERILGRTPKTIGLIFPTDQTEDLSLIRLYREWFARIGMTVAMGSPFNLTAGPMGEVLVLGEPCDVILRHYKTDWWGERLESFVDEEPFADPLPLTRELFVLTQGEANGRCAVVNPFASVVPQNKRAMAFMWEEIHRFSATARETIERHVPYTRRFDSMLVSQIIAERERWVLKSDYGAEGDQVCVGASVTETEWSELCARVVPTRWIVQERFVPELNERDEEENLGVYVIGGEAAGVYARVSVGATDRYSRSTAVLISGDEGRA